MEQIVKPTDCGSRYDWNNIVHDCFWVARGWWLWFGILTACYVMIAGMSGDTFWGSLWSWVSGACAMRYWMLGHGPDLKRFKDD
jgi:hypothetical protein